MNSKTQLSIKKIGATLLLAGTISSFAFATVSPKVREVVSEKAKKTLALNFPKAEGINWSENNGGKTYTANFTLYDVRTIASFDEEGQLISTLRYYMEDRLPISVITTVRKKYPDKTIAGVTEISGSQTGDVVYYLKLEDNTHWYTVKIAGDDVVETEKFEKQ
jgi:hypothetical protein